MKFDTMSSSDLISLASNKFLTIALLQYLVCDKVIQLKSYITIIIIICAPEKYKG